jgi:hypothetical protein
MSRPSGGLAFECFVFFDLFGLDLIGTRFLVEVSFHDGLAHRAADEVRKDSHACVEEALEIVVPKKLRLDKVRPQDGVELLFA